MRCRSMVGRALLAISFLSALKLVMADIQPILAAGSCGALSLAKANESCNSLRYVSSAAVYGLHPCRMSLPLLPAPGRSSPSSEFNIICANFAPPELPRNSRLSDRNPAVQFQLYTCSIILHA